MIKFIDEIIIDILKYDKKVVICGLSNRTKELLENNEFHSKIDFIFDNNSEILNKNYHSKRIIDIQVLKHLDEPLVIICGNHSLSIYAQLKKEGFNNCLIEYTPKLSKLFGEEFYFSVELPDFQSNHGVDISHDFAPLLIKELVKFNKPIKTIPTKHNNENYFRKREVNDNSFLFAYHSYGDYSNKIVYYKESYFPDMINTDAMGYSGWSSLCVSDSEIEEINKLSIENIKKSFEEYQNKYINNNISKYKQPKLNHEYVFPEKFAFFPLQVFNDSVMSLSYFNPYELLEKLIEIFSKNKEYLVIKRHPRCNLKEVEELLSKNENNPYLIIYNGSIHDAIDKSEVVYTINSGVGFESLFHLKPVVTFGKCDYQTATFEIKSLLELEKNLFPKLKKNKVEYIKKFVVYYLEKKNLLVSSSKEIELFVNKILIKNMNNELKVKYE